MPFIHLIMTFWFFSYKNETPETGVEPVCPKDTGFRDQRVCRFRHPGIHKFYKITLLIFSMYPLKHITFSLIFCLILFPFIGYNVIIVYIAAVFIDADHWLFYMVTKKDYSIKSLKKAYYYCKDNEFKDALHILHVVEFWGIIAILSFFYKFFFFIFIGIIFHLYLDLIELWLNPKSGDARTFSLLTWLSRNKINLKKSRLSN